MTRLAKLALAATLGLAITFTLTACDKESKTPAKIVGGTYSFGGDGNGSGSLMVYPLDERSALFYLSLSKGAPSYNSGELWDTMTIKDNAVIYDYYSDEYSNCKLISASPPCRADKAIPVVVSAGWAKKATGGLPTNGNNTPLTTAA